ncbi:MAG: UDP-4-amino-4,6-dideoxy-N-acetyl-beta-L-altrosamine transaminase [Psychrosphaera sp.]|nr:UDP-4-amino-4,6-dideoxy-N-acetyl-beta-L-altrosamine transaminase [Psychrosphaera sp.]
MSFIPYGKQQIDQQDIDAVVQTLTSDFLTQGPQIPAFEQRIAQLCQAKHACAFSSATAALHLACLALGVGKGDFVWTSPVTFVASANVALYCQADIDFVDINRETGLMCPDKLAEKLEQAAKSNRLPKVLIVVHLAGQSCEMTKIHALCQPYDIKIIEDASHAIGAKYQGQPVGNCRFSDITVFSFHPVKIMTTAEGGLATTQNPQLADKMALLRSHGITRDESLFTEPSHGPWYYQQIDLGFNYRMTDLQAALGISQSDKLTGFIEKRNELAHRYDQKFARFPLRPLQQLQPLQPLKQLKDNWSSYHLYVILTDEAQLPRKQLFEHLRSHNIGVNLHYIPVHLQPYYQQLGFKPGDFPQAEAYYKSAITLPLFPQLTDQQQDFVINCIQDLL